MTSPAIAPTLEESYVSLHPPAEVLVPWTASPTNSSHQGSSYTNTEEPSLRAKSPTTFMSDYTEDLSPLSSPGANSQGDVDPDRSAESAVALNLSMAVVFPGPFDESKVSAKGSNKMTLQPRQSRELFSALAQNTTMKESSVVSREDSEGDDQLQHNWSPRTTNFENKLPHDEEEQPTTTPTWAHSKGLQKKEQGTPASPFDEEQDGQPPRLRAVVVTPTNPLQKLWAKQRDSHGKHQIGANSSTAPLSQQMRSMNTTSDDIDELKLVPTDEKLGKKRQDAKRRLMMPRMLSDSNTAVPYQELLHASVSDEIEERMQLRTKISEEVEERMRAMGLEQEATMEESLRPNMPPEDYEEEEEPPSLQRSSVARQQQNNNSSTWTDPSMLLLDDMEPPRLSPRGNSTSSNLEKYPAMSLANVGVLTNNNTNESWCDTATERSRIFETFDSDNVEVIAPQQQQFTPDQRNNTTTSSAEESEECINLSLDGPTLAQLLPKPSPEGDDPTYGPDDFLMASPRFETIIEEESAIETSAVEESTNEFIHHSIEQQDEDEDHVCFENPSTQDTSPLREETVSAFQAFLPDTSSQEEEEQKDEGANVEEIRESLKPSKGPRVSPVESTVSSSHDSVEVVRSSPNRISKRDENVTIVMSNNQTDNPHPQFGPSLVVVDSKKPSPSKIHLPTMDLLSPATPGSFNPKPTRKPTVDDSVTEGPPPLRRPSMEGLRSSPARPNPDVSQATLNDGGGVATTLQSLMNDYTSILGRLATDQEKRIDPANIVDGRPVLVAPLISDIGIPKGDVLVSLLGKERTGSSRVHEAVWRGRTVRHNCDSAWLYGRVTRDSSSSTVDEVKRSLYSVASTQAAALNHLKFDELPDALSLYEEILAGYQMCLDGLVKKKSNKREVEEFQRYMVVALFNIGVLHMLRGDFTIACGFFDRALKALGDDGKAADDESWSEPITRLVRFVVSDVHLFVALCTELNLVSFVFVDTSREAWPLSVFTWRF